MEYTPKMEAPQNKMSSVWRAKKLVYTWVEVDVMLTKDDNTLELCTNGQTNFFF